MDDRLCAIPTCERPIALGLLRPTNYGCRSPASQEIAPLAGAGTDRWRAQSQPRILLDSYQLQRVAVESRRLGRNSARLSRPAGRDANPRGARAANPRVLRCGVWSRLE